MSSISSLTIFFVNRDFLTKSRSLPERIGIWDLAECRPERSVRWKGFIIASCFRAETRFRNSAEPAGAVLHEGNTVVSEEAVSKSHREIFYGLLFGVGAALLDTLIDATSQSKPFWDVSIGMILYRLLFILFGLLLGWLLWRKNTSEREFRSLQDEVQELRQRISAPTTVIHTQAQLLLGRDALQLSAEVQSAVRTIYEQTQKLQSIKRERVA